MLKDGTRVCDVCGDIIPAKTKYAVKVARPEAAEMFRSLGEADAEMAPTFTIDANGNVRVDIW